jgi:hypothetical protein
MTDACGMLSKIYTGERRDLVASILFVFPLLREVRSDSGVNISNSSPDPSLSWLC